MQHGKTTGILCSRWAKLIKDFYKPKKGHFDTTKVPDLYDNALYDMVHNRHLQLGSLAEVYGAARTLASYVVPQEYGVAAQDKVPPTPLKSRLLSARQPPCPLAEGSRG